MKPGAIHFEVKKHAVRQTADGWVVSFVVHPNDMDSAFAVSPLGTRYMLAVAQIGDDEQPVSPAATTGKEKLSATSHAVGEPKQRRPWHTLPPQQRAGMLCADKGFQKWASKKAGWGSTTFSEDTARDWLCRLIGIDSRADLGNDTRAERHFGAIEADFLRDSGRIPEVR